jgi:hypothetical protein
VTSLVLSDTQYRLLEVNYNTFERYFDRFMTRKCRLSIKPKFRPTAREMEQHYLAMEAYVRRILLDGCWCRIVGGVTPAYTIKRCELVVPYKDWALAPQPDWRLEEANWVFIQNWERDARNNCFCEEPS